MNLRCLLLTLCTLLSLSPLTWADLQTEILADNPIAYWRLDDEATPALDTAEHDNFPLANDAEAIANVTFGQPSLFKNDENSSVRTTGNGQLVSPPFEKMDDGGFSVEFWVRLDSSPTGHVNLIGDGESGGDFNLMVYAGNGGFVRAHVVAGGSVSAIDTDEKLIVGQVHHVVSTWDSTTGDLLLYLDGALATTRTIAGFIPTVGLPANSDNAIYIGKDGRESGPSATFDEVAIYNYPLPAARVAAHYGAVEVVDPIEPPTFGVPVGESALIAELDYSDSFTIGENAPGDPRKTYDQGFPLPLDVAEIEDSHGNIEVSWTNTAFSITTDDTVNPGATGYPGSSGAGSDTGFTQRGGGGDWSIGYGLRDLFVVQTDVIQMNDRVDIVIGDTPDTIGSGGNISIFFRTTGFVPHPEIGLYNPLVGEVNTGLGSGIANARTWNNYALLVDIENELIEVFVNEESRGVIDLQNIAGGAFAGLLNNNFVGLGGAGNDRVWSDNFQVGSAAVDPPVRPEPPANRGVAVGSSTLLDSLDYSDTFTIGPEASIFERETYGAQGFPLPAGVDIVENNHGNADQFWGSTNWSIATDTAVNHGGTGYPGGTGAGSETGFTQRGGGGDWSIPYGLRDVFVVQTDFVQTADRVDLTVGATPSNIAGEGNLSVFFRKSGQGTEIGLYNGGVGEVNTGLTSEIPAATLWNNYALKVDIPNDSIEIFVNEVSRGVIDLSTFAEGAFAGILNNSFVGVGAAGSDRLWTDNFQVGPPAEDPGPAVPPVLTNVGFDPASSEISLTWDSRDGARYKVEITFDLALETWPQLVDDWPSDGDSTNITLDISPILPPGAKSAFFRVRELE